MSKQDILNLTGEFTWGFGSSFFIETENGNFEWEDPEYGGNNTLKKVDYDYNQWIKLLNIPFGREKGTHIIKDYCKNVIIISTE